jgi:hypothetical protein
VRSPAIRLRPWLIIGTAVLAAAVVAPAALAIYPKQSIKLTGPEIGGVKPSGSALVEQCELPTEPGILTVTVKSVNLPDGTVLTVNYGGVEAGGGENLGTFTLEARAGSFVTTLPFQAGANDNIAVMNGSTIVLSASNRWKTSTTCEGKPR